MKSCSAYIFLLLIIFLLFFTNKNIVGGNNQTLDKSTFDKLYSEWPEGANGEEEEEDVAPTYGKMEYEGLVKLVKHLNINKKDTFLDCGSGIGNVVAFFGMNTDVKKATGVEIIKSRHKSAVRLIKKLKTNKCNFKNKNINNIDFNDSTIIFTCSTCFSENLMNLINKKCESNKNLKYLISQKSIDNTKLKYLGSVDIKTSWNDSTTHHIYTNRKDMKMIKT